MPDPSDEQVREYLSGNLCRCAGYADILRAVRVAQQQRTAGGTAAAAK
ncbi:MAG TPA: 2Fe-2S iron-sulfur cluster-binding protein [Candidatus Binatia bacterium]